MSDQDDPTIPPPRRRLPSPVQVRRPPVLRYPKAPGSQDSHPVLTDEEAKRFWEELQDVDVRLKTIEQERGRDISRLIVLGEKVDTLSQDTDELWRESRSLRKRHDASIQDDIVTARQIADLEKRLAARADLAAEEVAGPLAARTGSKEARKWAGLVTGLGVLAELIRWYFAAQGK